MSYNIKGQPPEAGLIEPDFPYGLEKEAGTASHAFLRARPGFDLASLSGGKYSPGCARPILLGYSVTHTHTPTHMHGHTHSLCLHARHRRSTYSVGGRTEAHTISAASQWGDAAKSRQSGHSTGAFRRTHGQAVILTELLPLSELLRLGLTMSWLLAMWISLSFLLLCQATLYQTIQQHHVARPGRTDILTL
ncbi:hypothetical protein AMECASPLE_020305, partial [Ameca splendens]